MERLAGGRTKVMEAQRRILYQVFGCFLKFQLEMLKAHEDAELSEAQFAAAKRMARLFTTIVSSHFATTQGLRSLDEALQANQALLVWTIKSLNHYFVVRTANLLYYLTCPRHKNYNFGRLCAFSDAVNNSSRCGKFNFRQCHASRRYYNDKKGFECRSQ